MSHMNFSKTLKEIQHTPVVDVTLSVQYFFYFQAVSAIFLKHSGWFASFFFLNWIYLKFWVRTSSSRSKFLHFHGEIWPNNSLAPPFGVDAPNLGNAGSAAELLFILLYIP